MLDSLSGCALPRPDRYLEPLLKLNRTSLIAAIFASGICVWILTVLPVEYLGPMFLKHPGSSIVYDAHFLTRWALFSMLLGPVALAVSLILYGEFIAKVVRRQIRSQLTDGRAERCRFTIQRSLELENPKGSYLLLKIQWNGLSRVLFIPPRAIRDLKINSDIENYTNGETDMLYRPFVFLAIRTHGKPVPTRVSSLRPKLFARYLKSVHMFSSEESVMSTRKSKGSYFTSD